MTRNKCFSNIAPKGGTTASEGVALEPTKKKGNNNFINVLHEMIEVESNDVIEWSKGGRSFIIHEENTEALAKSISKYFRHNKYTSFQRQCNLYNFSKPVKGDFKGTFFHPKFRRGEVAKFEKEWGNEGCGDRGRVGESEAGGLKTQKPKPKPRNNKKKKHIHIDVPGEKKAARNLTSAAAITKMTRATAKPRPTPRKQPQTHLPPMTAAIVQGNGKSNSNVDTPSHGVGADIDVDMEAEIEAASMLMRITPVQRPPTPHPYSHSPSGVGGLGPSSMYSPTEQFFNNNQISPIFPATINIDSSLRTSINLRPRKVSRKSNNSNNSNNINNSNNSMISVSSSNNGRLSDRKGTMGPPLPHPNTSPSFDSLKLLTSIIRSDPPRRSSSSRSGEMSVSLPSVDTLDTFGPLSCNNGVMNGSMNIIMNNGMDSSVSSSMYNSFSEGSHSGISFESRVEELFPPVETGTSDKMNKQKAINVSIESDKLGLKRSARLKRKKGNLK